jgi:acyl-CoA reductase-like NAD-dependent aldehyde dehydrogenase
MIEVVQAFDRTPIAELDGDDAAALDRKIEAARWLFADRGTWLTTHYRIEILRKLAGLMDGKRQHLGRQIAREGGKRLSDALIETDRAIDGRAECSRRAARHGRPGNPDGADASEYRSAGLHNRRADRDRRRHVSVQSPPEQYDAASVDHRQPAARRQSLDPRSVRPNNLRLSLHAAPRCSRRREFATASVSSQHLHRRSPDGIRCERLAPSAVMVNDHTAFRTDWMPFAGRRQSGYGIGGVHYTMQAMSEEKMIVFRM